MRHKHLFKKYFIPSLIFFIGICIGFSCPYYINITFRIQHVEVVGGTQEERVMISQLLKGLSTLTSQPSDINTIIHMKFPVMQIKESHIVFPNTLILVVNDEKPFAYLTTDYGYLVLSKSGIIIRKERSLITPHPAITFYQIIHHSEHQMGQRIEFTAIERALTFIALLEDVGYQTETVAIDSVDMIACKTKGFEIAFSQSRSIETQSYEVRQVVRQIKAGALRIERLDVRFDKPVVQLLQK